MFTVLDANALVPWLSAVFTEVRADVDELLARRSWEGVSKSEPGMVYAGDSDGRILELEERIQSLLHEVASLGMEIRRVDGMVDFPSWRNGELVYLCWRLGEPKVLYWHAMHSGWPERKRLDEAGEELGLFEADTGFREPEAEL
ncbi:MAG: DUF2203 domain-containing protein [Myxococcales bacterium]|nr:DUF2203 domain-containing protein [Myxococcales bacterium]